MTVEPITDEELAYMRTSVAEMTTEEGVALRELIARIDLERNRADRAEADFLIVEEAAELKAGIAHRLQRELRAAEAEVARLRGVYDAVEAYGANNDLSHDETGEGPHDRRRCRTCRLADAFGAAALAAPPGKEMTDG